MAQQARLEIGSLPGRRRTAQAVQAATMAGLASASAHQRGVSGLPLERAAWESMPRDNCGIVAPARR